jgi:hypothetical protein
MEQGQNRPPSKAPLRSVSRPRTEPPTPRLFCANRQAFQETPRAPWIAPGVPGEVRIGGTVSRRGDWGSDAHPFRAVSAACNTNASIVHG